MKITDEAALVLAAQQGDEQAFDQLVEEYEPDVFNECSRVLYGLDAAYQIAQEITRWTFETAWVKLPQWKTPPEARSSAPYRAYLLKIARNHSLDERRKPEHQRTDHITDEEVGRMPSKDPNPEQLALRKCVAEAVQDCVSKLPDNLRQVIHFLYRIDFTDQQAAQALNVARNTILNRKKSAHQSLRKCMRLKGFTELEVCEE